MSVSAPEVGSKRRFWHPPESEVAQVQQRLDQVFSQEMLSCQTADRFCEQTIGGASQSLGSDWTGYATASDLRAHWQWFLTRLRVVPDLLAIGGRLLSLNITVAEPLTCGNDQSYVDC